VQGHLPDIERGWRGLKIFAGLFLLDQGIIRANPQDPRHPRSIPYPPWDSEKAAF